MTRRQGDGSQGQTLHRGTGERMRSRTGARKPGGALPRARREAAAAAAVAARSRGWPPARAAGRCWRPACGPGRAPRRLCIAGLGLLGLLPLGEALEVTAHEASMLGMNKMRMAPWYCPPTTDSKAIACASKFRFGQAPLYLQTVIVPNAVRVLLMLSEDPRVSPNFSAAAHILLTLAEAIRLVICTARFQACFSDRTVYIRLQEELCQLAAFQQVMLAEYGGLADGDSVCYMFYHHGDVNALLRAISGPLHDLVVRSLPEAAPHAVGNAGTRFDFEYFYDAYAKGWQQREAAGPMARPFDLSYPAIFTPGALCGAKIHTSRFRGPDAVGVVRHLADSGVPLSHFVINFGAADGECGSGDDWNADPANCLIAAGDAALLVEGDEHWFPRLQERFGHRANVSLILRFLELGKAADLIREHLARMPEASASPDLLKVDVDHADCEFMHEALQAAHPKVVHVEYMPMAPPPWEYAQRYQSRLLDVRLNSRTVPLLASEVSREHVKEDVVDSGLGLEMTGCSLGAFLSRAPGYALLSVGDEEAVLVRRDLLPALGVRELDAWDGWVEGALCHPLHNLRPDLVAWGFDFRVLADQRIDEHQRLQWLEDLLLRHGATAFSLSSPSLPEWQQRGRP